MGGDVLGGADADEPGGEAGIAEVELGSFDEALGDVCEPGLDEKDKVAGLEDGEPSISSDAGDADVVGEGGNVE